MSGDLLRITAAGSGAGKYTQRLEDGRHVLTADEPAEVRDAFLARRLNLVYDGDPPEPSPAKAPTE